MSPSIKRGGILGGESKLGFGILGCGVIGPHHAAVISASNREASLVTVTDTVPERARQLGQQYGATADHTMQALLARDEIDVVSICTPSMRSPQWRWGNMS